MLATRSPLAFGVVGLVKGLAGSGEVFQTAEGVTLTLHDNGPGFSPEALARAREPFFTTKTSAQGLGLGLAICDTLMRALGGELLLANHPDGGALLTLRLGAGAPGVNLPPFEDIYT